MPFFSGQLTLTAAAQRLSNCYGGASNTPPNTVNQVQDIPFREVKLQATGAAVRVGSEANKPDASTTYGLSIAADATESWGGFSEGPIKLSDIWVQGAGAVVRVTGIPF